MKKYILIAGVNGAGKSTLYDQIAELHEMPRINTDEILRANKGDWRSMRDVILAGKQAVNLMEDYLTKGLSFNQETTLAGNKIISTVQRAKTLGYSVELHYVGVNDVSIAIERVKQRVQNGGHGIPEEDIVRRYASSLENLQKIIPLCNEIHYYDNSDIFRKFAIYEDECLTRLSDMTPEWYEQLLPMMQRHVTRAKNQKRI